MLINVIDSDGSFKVCDYITDAETANDAVRELLDIVELDEGDNIYIREY